MNTITRRDQSRGLTLQDRSQSVYLRTTLLASARVMLDPSERGRRP